MSITVKAPPKCSGSRYSVCSWNLEPGKWGPRTWRRKCACVSLRVLVTLLGLLPPLPPSIAICLKSQGEVSIQSSEMACGLAVPQHAMGQEF